MEDKKIKGFNNCGVMTNSQNCWRLNKKKCFKKESSYENVNLKTSSSAITGVEKNEVIKTVLKYDLNALTGKSMKSCATIRYIWGFLSIRDILPYPMSYSLSECRCGDHIGPESIYSFLTSEIASLVCMKQCWAKFWVSFSGYPLVPAICHFSTFLGPPFPSLSAPLVA